MLINKEEKFFDLAKAIIAISESLDSDNTKLALIAAKYNLEILISKTYKEAVNNANYG